MGPAGAKPPSNKRRLRGDNSFLGLRPCFRAKAESRKESDALESMSAGTEQERAGIERGITN